MTMRLLLTIIDANLSNLLPGEDQLKAIYSAAQNLKQNIAAKVNAEEFVVVLAQEEGGELGNFAYRLREYFKQQDNLIAAHTQGYRTVTTGGNRFGFVSTSYFTPSLSMRVRTKALDEVRNTHNSNKGATIVNVNLEPTANVIIPTQFASAHLDSKNDLERLIDTRELMRKFHGGKVTLTFAEFAQSVRAIQVVGADLNSRYNVQEKTPTTYDSSYDPSADTLFLRYGFSTDGPRNTTINGDPHALCNDNPMHYSTYNKHEDGRLELDKKRTEKQIKKNAEKDKEGKWHPPLQAQYQTGHLDDNLVFIAGQIHGRQSALVKEAGKYHVGRYGKIDHVPVVTVLDVEVETDLHALMKASALKQIQVFYKGDKTTLTNKINVLDLNVPADQETLMSFYNLYAILRELHVVVKIIRQSHFLPEHYPHAIVDELLTQIEIKISEFLFNPNTASAFRFYNDFRTMQIPAVANILKAGAEENNCSKEIEESLNFSELYEFLERQSNAFTLVLSAAAPALIFSAASKETLAQFQERLHETKARLQKAVQAANESFRESEKKKGSSSHETERKPDKEALFTFFTAQLKEEPIDDKGIDKMIEAMEYAIITFIDTEVPRKNATKDFKKEVDQYLLSVGASASTDIRLLSFNVRRNFERSLVGNESTCLKKTGAYVRKLLDEMYQLHSPTYQQENAPLTTSEKKRSRRLSVSQWLSGGSGSSSSTSIVTSNDSNNNSAQGIITATRMRSSSTNSNNQ